MADLPIRFVASLVGDTEVSNRFGRLMNTMASMSAATTGVRVDTPPSLTNRFIDSVKARIASVGATATATGAKMTRMGLDTTAAFKQMSTSAKIAATDIRVVERSASHVLEIFAGLAIYRGFGILTREIHEAAQAMTTLQHSSALVQTQFSELEPVGIGKTSKDVIQTAQLTGQALEGLSGAYFDIVSAGVAFQKNQGDVRKALLLSAKAATAGATDTRTAFNAAFAQMSAFNEPVENMNKIYDQHFEIVRSGIIEYETLAAEVAEFSIAGKRAGQDLDTVNSAAATLSQIFQGPQFAEGSTRLKRFFLAFTEGDIQGKINRTANEFGFLSVQIADENGQFRDMLDVIDELGTELDKLPPTQRAAALSMIFTEERAATGADVLINLRNEWRRVRDTTSDSTNVMQESFNEMAETIQVQSGKIAGNIAMAFGGPSLAIIEKMTSGMLTLTSNTFGVKAALVAAAGAAIVVTATSIAQEMATKKLNATQAFNTLILEKNTLVGTKYRIGMQLEAAILERNNARVINSADAHLFGAQAVTAESEARKEKIITLHAESAALDQEIQKKEAAIAAEVFHRTEIVATTMARTAMVAGMVLAVIGMGVLGNATDEGSKTTARFGAIITAVGVSLAVYGVALKAFTALRVTAASVEETANLKVAGSYGTLATMRAIALGPAGIAALIAAAAAGLIVYNGVMAGFEQRMKNTASAASVHGAETSKAFIEAMVREAEKGVKPIEEAFKTIGIAAKDALTAGFKPDDFTMFTEAIEDNAKEALDILKSAKKEAEEAGWMEFLAGLGSINAGTTGRATRRFVFGEDDEEALRVLQKIFNSGLTLVTSDGTPVTSIDHILRENKADLAREIIDTSINHYQSIYTQAEKALITATDATVSDLKDSLLGNMESVELTAKGATAAANAFHGLSSTVGGLSQMFETFEKTIENLNSLTEVRNLTIEQTNARLQGKLVGSDTISLGELAPDLFNAIEEAMLRDLLGISGDIATAMQEIEQKFKDGELTVEQFFQNLENASTDMVDVNKRMLQLVINAKKTSGLIHENDHRLLQIKRIELALELAELAAKRGNAGAEEAIGDLTDMLINEMIKLGVGFDGFDAESLLKLTTSIVQAEQKVQETIDIMDRIGNLGSLDSPFAGMVDAGNALEAAGFYFGDVAGGWQELGQRWAMIQSQWEVATMTQSVIGMAADLRAIGVELPGQFESNLRTIGVSLIQQTVPALTQILAGLETSIFDESFWETIAQNIQVQQQISQGVTISPFIVINRDDDVMEQVQAGIQAEARRLGLSIANPSG